MNCPRCEAELPTSATICSNCGSPIRQDTSRAFSYLPEGTPPWPTSVPSRTARAVATAPIVAGAAGGRPKRSTRSVVVMVALLLLAPILGVAATLGILYANGRFPANTEPQTSASIVTVPTATPTAVPEQSVTPPASMQKAKSTDINIAYSYPKEWAADPAQKTSSLTYITLRSQQQYSIIIYLTQMSATTSTTFKNADEVNQANVSNLSSSGAVQDSPAPSANPQLGGVAWSETDKVFVDSGSGTVVHFASLAVLHNKLYYNIIIFIPTVYYTDAMKQYITPILGSLQFIS